MYCEECGKDTKHATCMPGWQCEKCGAVISRINEQVDVDELAHYLEEEDAKLEREKHEVADIFWHKYPDIPLDEDLSDEDFIIVAYDFGGKKSTYVARVGEVSSGVDSVTGRPILDAHIYAWAWKNIAPPNFN